MDLDFESGKGTLSYNTKGSKMLNLKVLERIDYGGVKTYDDMTIEEYDYNGNYTGKMVGQFDSIVFCGGEEYTPFGGYIRRDGKEFDFYFEISN